jgi:tetratricopeptide (TPR) repeat protein
LNTEKHWVEYMTNKEFNQESFEQIERYLMQEMGAEELRGFEERLSKEAILKAEVEMQKDSMLAVELQAMSESLKKVASEESKPKGGAGGLVIPFLNSRTIFAIAAGLAIILGLFSVFNPFQSQEEKLFAEYYNPDPGLPVPMSAVSHYDFYDAMVDYKAEKYDLALEKWKTLLAQDNKNDTLQYFVASSLLNLDDMEASIPMLVELSKRDDSRFKERATWYLALAYLKENKPESVKGLTVPPSSIYHSRLQELQSNLP